MRVGVDIHSRCSKCGDVWHVVVANVPGRVAQVECKECGARHRYRSTDASKPRAPARRSAAGGKSKPPPGPLVEPDLSRPVRAYLTSDTYEVGERIDHKSFGPGVIERILGPSKVQVYFSDGSKTLIHGKL